MRSDKIFIVGFHKTGTSSMTKALEILGYKVAGPNLELLNSVKTRDLNRIFQTVDEYDAFQDDPWFLLYRELDQEFPNSKFILTERDSGKWIKSVQKHFGDSISPMRKYIYGSFGSLEAPALYIEKYNKHNDDVKKYFDERGDFIEFKLENGEGWKELCRFLNKPIPKRILSRKILPFPHANRGSSRASLKQKLFKTTDLNFFRRRSKTFIKNYFGSEGVRKITRIKDFFLFRLRF